MDIIKKNKWRIIIALLTYILPILSIAQVTTYPVQVYTQLIPPYTPYVPAYYSVGQNKLKVTIINSDMQQPTLQVYLKMRITSSTFSMINPPEVRLAPMELQAGVPLILTQNDLEPYFKSQNVRISGGQSQFYRTQMLPDNFYRFHFEVFELNTNRLLSNNRIGFAQAMITAGDPPLLNLPTKGSVVKESNIPNIMFTWTPRHMASVASAYGTEYEITLVEIQDKQANPDNAFQYSRVLYTETTRSTAFIHTAAQPMLIPGMRYGWRVRAIAREGVEEANVFKNNGFSEIFWFDYKGNCSTVSTSGVITKRTEANISWTPTEAIDYTLEYRPKGSTKWYTGTISGNSGKLYSLKPGETYEYRIGSRCYMNDLYDYSDMKAFTMPIELQRSPNCGVLPNINLSNQTPARELQAGLPVLVGDFPVFITKVTGSGRFSGEGYVGIPYLDGAQIGVTFKDIVVNTDNQMISGFFETKYNEKENNLLFDGDQILTGGKGVGDIRDGEEKVAFIVNYAINSNVKAKPIKEDGSVDNIDEVKDYTFSKGENGRYQFVIVDEKDEEHKVDTETMPVTIEDSTGSTFEVNEKGKVSKISSNAGIVLDEKSKDQFNPKLAIIDFKESTNSRYALDTYNDVYQKVTEYNDQYRIGDTENCASAKFILPGTTDDVTAFIKSEGSNAQAFTPEKVKFITAKGKEYQSKYNAESRTWTITVTGGAVKDGQELYAVQEQSADKYLTLGKLNIFTYEPLQRSVTLVPVNGTMNNLSVQSVKEQLDRIYGKIGIEWTVNKLDADFKYTPLNGSTFNVTGSGLLSTLTNDMKAINETFKTSGQYQADGLYLFVLPFAPSDKGEVADTGGDMPLSSQFGYLFSGADGKTIAHELAHGAFNIEHPFSRPGRNSFAKGALTNNLMDYTDGSQFAKLQWDQTRAPGMVIGLFQKDKDAMLAGKLKGIHIREKALYGLPGARVVELENITVEAFCSTTGYNDYLFSFIDAQGNQWDCDNTVSNPQGFYFQDYENNKTKVLRNSVIRKVRDGDTVYRIFFDNKKSTLEISKIIFGELDRSVLNSNDIYTFFERAGNYKNNIKSSELLYTAIVENPCGESPSDSDDLEGVLSDLQTIKNNSKPGQYIELEHWDTKEKKLKYYTLQNDKLVEVDKPLSNEAILNGNWSDKSETRIRYTRIEGGVIQVKAIGIKNGIQLKGKELASRKLSEHITEQTNKFLQENKVTDFNKKAKFDNPEEEFADGGRIAIEGSFSQIIQEGLDVTVTLLKTGEVEESVYLTTPKEPTSISAPGLLTGSFEVVAQKVTDITSLGTLAYDMVVDKQARSEMYQQLVGLKDQIAEEPDGFLPIMGEILLTVGTGNTSEDWQTIADENADVGKRSHLVTRGTGNAIVTVATIGTVVKKLPEIGDKLTDWVKNIKKSRKLIREVMNTGEAKEYLRKFFNTKNIQGSFDEWYESMLKNVKGRLYNFEVHHVITVHLLEDNKELQRLFEKFGFDSKKFNGIENGIPLQKKSLKNGIPGHSSHPKYEEFMNNEINKILSNSNITDEKKFEQIQELIKKMKNKLETDVLTGTKDVNDIVSW